MKPYPARFNTHENKTRTNVLDGPLDTLPAVREAIGLLLTAEPTGDVFRLLSVCDKMEHLDEAAALHFAQIALGLLLTAELEKFPIDENEEAAYTYF